MTRLYPVGLKLAGKRCLVVGAGAVAERKIAALLAADGVVHVVAPEASAANPGAGAGGAADMDCPACLTRRPCGLPAGDHMHR